MAIACSQFNDVVDYPDAYCLRMDGVALSGFVAGLLGRRRKRKLAA